MWLKKCSRLYHQQIIPRVISTYAELVKVTHGFARPMILEYDYPGARAMLKYDRAQSSLVSIPLFKKTKKYTGSKANLEQIKLLLDQQTDINEIILDGVITNYCAHTYRPIDMTSFRKDRAGKYFMVYNVLDMLSLNNKDYRPLPLDIRNRDMPNFKLPLKKQVIPSLPITQQYLRQAIAISKIEHNSSKVVIKDQTAQYGSEGNWIISQQLFYETKQEHHVAELVAYGGYYDKGREQLKKFLLCAVKQKQFVPVFRLRPHITDSIKNMISNLKIAQRTSSYQKKLVKGNYEMPDVYFQNPPVWQVIYVRASFSRAYSQGAIDNGSGYYMLKCSFLRNRPDLLPSQAMQYSSLIEYFNKHWSFIQFYLNQKKAAAQAKERQLKERISKQKAETQIIMRATKQRFGQMPMLQQSSQSHQPQQLLQSHQPQQSSQAYQAQQQSQSHKSHASIQQQINMRQRQLLQLQQQQLHEQQEYIILQDQETQMNQFD